MRTNLLISSHLISFPSIFGWLWGPLILNPHVSCWVLTSSVNVGGRNVGQRCLSSQHWICSNICWVLFWVCGQEISSRVGLLKLDELVDIYLDCLNVCVYSVVLFYCICLNMCVCIYNIYISNIRCLHNNFQRPNSTLQYLGKTTNNWRERNKTNVCF